MKTVIVAVLLASAALPPSAVSFVKLSGKRLTRFHRTKAASEAGRNVALHLPTSVLKKGRVKPLGRSKRWVVFAHRGVEYVVSRRDPYLIQAARKVRKNSRGGVLVKGTVVATGSGAEKKRWVVRVKSLQKYGKRAGRR